MEPTEKKWAYEMMIPILAKTLLTIGGECRMPAIRILNSHCKRVTSFDYSSESERLKGWISRNELFIHLLSKDVTEAEYDQSKYILSLYGRSQSSHEKTNELLRLLRDNENKNKMITKFCLKKLEVYSMSSS